jgi:hypothetical protein
VLPPLLAAQPPPPYRASADVAGRRRPSRRLVVAALLGRDRPTRGSQEVANLLRPRRVDTGERHRQSVEVRLPSCAVAAIERVPRQAAGDLREALRVPPLLEPSPHDRAPAPHERWRGEDTGLLATTRHDAPTLSRRGRPGEHDRAPRVRPFRVRTLAVRACRTLPVYTQYMKGRNYS